MAGVSPLRRRVTLCNAGVSALRCRPSFDPPQKKAKTLHSFADWKPQGLPASATPWWLICRLYCNALFRYTSVISFSLQTSIVFYHWYYAPKLSLFWRPPSGNYNFLHRNISPAKKVDFRWIGMVWLKLFVHPCGKILVLYTDNTTLPIPRSGRSRERTNVLPKFHGSSF